MMTDEGSAQAGTATSVIRDWFLSSPDFSPDLTPTSLSLL